MVKGFNDCLLSEYKDEVGMVLKNCLKVFKRFYIYYKVFMKMILKEYYFDRVNFFFGNNVIGVVL